MSGHPPAGAQRRDVALVARGLARSRGHARELVDAGQVLVAGRPALKAGARIDPDHDLSLAHDSARWIATTQWVGRGATKLLGALDHWSPQLDVAGRRAADIGASTGGFTQVLLARGAREVIAIDVGHGQLAPALSGDPRVVERSGVSVRGLSPHEIGGPVEVLVADVSFISLALVMPDLAHLCGPAADLILLVKPQFEIGRERLGKNGVVRSARDRAAAVAQVVSAARECGLQPCDVSASPVVGTHGNHEYFVWLSTGSDAGAPTESVLAERINELTMGQA